MELEKYKEAEILMRERRNLEDIRTCVNTRIEKGHEIPILGSKITNRKLKEEFSFMLLVRIQEIDKQIKEL